MSIAYLPEPHIQELGDGFYDPVRAAIFPKSILRFRNDDWARRLGLDGLSESEWVRHFAGFAPLAQNLPEPLALRYHGHQFRNYNPDLGDGRGFLFAQVRDPIDQRLLDFGTKGSGQTPWSRTADGRLTLKGAVREILATEMLEALGVNTSKTFSVIETGENLIRHDEPSPTRAAVLVRLSHSHIRFGSFQRHAYHDDRERLQKLLHYSLRNYYPEILQNVRDEDHAAEFLKAVSERSAQTCAAWMMAGFVHGVLNTDNMNITGESFDYGPYRFLPIYDPSFTAAYFDHEGLYAYGQQPESVFWNLQQLAACLALLTENQSSLNESLAIYPKAFNISLRERFAEKLGVQNQPWQIDEILNASFSFLSKSGVGFEQFFFDWYAGDSTRAFKQSPEREKYQGEEFENFRQALKKQSPTSDALTRLQNPYFQNRLKPCTVLIDEIESIWGDISEHDNWQKLNDKVKDIRHLRDQVWNRGPHAVVQS